MNIIPASLSKIYHGRKLRRALEYFGGIGRTTDKSLDQVKQKMRSNIFGAIDNGLDPDAFVVFDKNKGLPASGTWPLVVACETGDLALVQGLIERGATPGREMGFFMWVGQFHFDLTSPDTLDGCDMVKIGRLLGSYPQTHRMRGHVRTENENDVLLDLLLRLDEQKIKIVIQLMVDLDIHPKMLANWQAGRHTENHDVGNLADLIHICRNHKGLWSAQEEGRMIGKEIGAENRRADESGQARKSRM